MTAYANKAQLLAHFFTHKKVSFFFVVNIECVFFFLVVSVYEFVYVRLCVQVGYEMQNQPIFPKLPYLSYLYVNLGISV